MDNEKLTFSWIYGFFAWVWVAVSGYDLSLAWCGWAWVDMALFWLGVGLRKGVTYF